MSKISKKSINDLMKAYNKNRADTYILKLKNPQDDTIALEIPVKTSFSIGEIGMFVDRVVNACFDNDGNYLPQYYEPVFEITLLQMTTPIPAFETTMEDDGGETIQVLDIARTYDLCKALELWKRVSCEEYQALLRDLRSLTEEKLEYMKGVHMRQISSAFHVLKPALEELSGTLANMDLKELEKQLKEQEVTSLTELPIEQS